MTIPLARIHHLEQAIRRRRRYARELNAWDQRRYSVGLRNMIWWQYQRVTGLLQALHRSRAVYHHNAAKLETTKV